MTPARVTLPVCVLLMLGACGPGAESSGELVFVLQAEDGSLTEGGRGEFFVGTAAAGDTRETRLVLKNVGTASVDLAPIVALGGARTSIPGGEVTPGAVFELSSPAVPRLEPGAQTELSLSFHPPREGRFVSSVRVNTAAVTIIGEGTPKAPTTESPGLSLLPEGGTLVVLAPWFSSTPLTTIRHVWFANNGSSAREIHRASIEPLNDESLESELALDLGEEGLVLAPGAEHAKSLELRITPVSIGAKRWRVTFFTSDPEAPELVLDLQVQAFTPTDCRVFTTPRHVSFGLISSGGRDVQVTVTNLGTSPTELCLITDVGFLPGSSEWISLPDGEVPPTLVAPGESMTIPVRVTAPPTSEGPQQAVLTFHANAQGKPQEEITFDIGGQPSSCLTLMPNSHDFGSVPLRCAAAPRSFDIYNGCGTPVVVTSIDVGHTSGGTEFELVGSPNLPPDGTLASGQTSMFLRAHYEPVDVGADTGTISVVAQHGDRVDTLVLSLQGEGRPAHVQTDEFVESEPQSGWSYSLGYFLSSTPDLSVGPIEVTVDGQAVPPVNPSGQVVWTYAPFLNAIRFEPGFRPQGGQTLEVTYFTACFP